MLRPNLDALGIGASLLCAIHCAVLPLVATTLPVFGINIIHNPYFEWFMICVAAVVGLMSLRHGLKHHHSWLPVIIFAAGMFFLVARQVWHQYEVVFLAPAVMLIVAAHIYNYKLLRRSKKKACNASCDACV